MTKIIAKSSQLGKYAKFLKSKLQQIFFLDVQEQLQPQEVEVTKKQNP
jgi:hypothetical protein